MQINNSGKEVEAAQLELESSSKTTTMELQGQEFWPLSGKPYFHVVLSKSNLKPSYHLTVSAEIQKVVPSLEIPTFLIFKDNEWQMVYQGQSKHKKFDGWKSFAMDNKLEIGDACVFELLDYSTQVLKFRVQILRGKIPSEFLDYSKNGLSKDTPIIIN